MVVSGGDGSGDVTFLKAMLAKQDDTNNNAVTVLLVGQSSFLFFAISLLDTAAFKVFFS